MICSPDIFQGQENIGINMCSILTRSTTLKQKITISSRQRATCWPDGFYSQSRLSLQSKTADTSVKVSAVFTFYSVLSFLWIIEGRLWAKRNSILFRYFFRINNCTRPVQSPIKQRIWYIFSGPSTASSWRRNSLKNRMEQYSTIYVGRSAPSFAFLL